MQSGIQFDRTWGGPWSLGYRLFPSHTSPPFRVRESVRTRRRRHDSGPARDARVLIGSSGHWHCETNGVLSAHDAGTPQRRSFNYGFAVSTLLSTGQSHYSPKEFAAYLGVCYRTIIRWVKDGKIPAPRRLSSRCLRFTREDVIAFAQKLDKQRGCPKS